jgi:SP family arabinose:H+ symporter-like MFS transporter
VNLLATFVGMALIDRVGRKILLLIGAAGTAACVALVSVIFFTHQYQAMLVWALIVYIAFFAVSQGAVIWVYISEIFPTRVRGKGQSLGSGTHWIVNAIIWHLSGDRCAFWSLSIRLFRGDDVVAVCCCAALLS